jgi:hypothetical protein
MKGHLESRGRASRVKFDPVDRAFVTQDVHHPFLDRVEPVKAASVEEFAEMVPLRLKVKRSSSTAATKWTQGRRSILG